MKNLNLQLFKNHWPKFLSISLFVILFSAYINIFAFFPGETLNPNCAPGDGGCVVDSIPSQTGNANKYLTTDGTTMSWFSTPVGVTASSSEIFTNKDLTSGTNTFPTLNQSTSGNAATATALQNARTIFGISFNGTANIGSALGTAAYENTGYFATAGHNHTGVYAPVLGVDDNYVTDAQLTVLGNTSGTNTGDNAINSNYSSDYRAANFVAGVNYLAPNGSAAALTSFPTLNQNTSGTAAGLSSTLTSTSGGSGVNNVGTLTWGSGGSLGTAAYTASTAYQAANTNLAAIGALANATGFLYNNGAGAFSYAAAGAGDMVISGIQTVTGVKTFNDTKLLMRNVAGTFNGSFTNTNTADRVYTLPNYSDTLTTLAGNEALTNKSVNGVTLSTGAGAAVFLAGDGLYKAVGGTGANALGTYIVQSTINAPANAQILGSLGTGIVKNTTTTGVLSIAVAGDFPTLNQNTSGTAASLSAILSSTLGGSGVNNAGTLTWGAGGTLGTNAYTSTGYLSLAGGTMTGGITNSTSINPLTTLAESWIGPSSTTGVYFKGGNVGVGTTNPQQKLHVNGSFFSGDASDGVLLTSSAGVGSILGIDAGFAGWNNLDIRSGSLIQLYLSTNGNVGIGITSPTAVLHLKAGTATANTAPLKFTNTSAVLLGTAETGAMEYDGTNLYFTPTGTTRKTVAYTSDIHAPVTLGTANGLSLSTQALSLGLASSGVTGALSGTDWNTFNNKVSSQWTTTGSDIYYNTGRAFIGSTSESTSGAKLALTGTTAVSGSTAGVIGVLGDYTFNPTAGGYQVGNRFVVTNNPTNSTPNTALGEIIRMVDNTSLSNAVRGLDITSNGGSNTNGTNTGVRATGATFGVQGITNATAGGVFAPAALYGENTGTSAGDILRLYSKSVTSAPSFATFYHEGSAFSGTGLLMDFANTDINSNVGTFTGDFINLKKSANSVFKVTNAGIVSMGLSSISSGSAVCSSLGGGATPAADFAYEIRDCSLTPVADYAEMYPVDSSIVKGDYGDIVTTGGEVVETYDIKESGEIDWTKVKGNVSKLIKANTPYQTNVIGIVSDNYGDFSSVGYNIKEKDNPLPIALNGRVPVKISSSSESIKAGDYLTTSSEAGKATKATESGFVVGKALEDWDNTSGKSTVMIFVENGYNEIPVYQNLGLKLLNIMDMSKPNIWRDSIIFWLGNAANKITRIFTGEICLVDDTGQSECINRSELRDLKNLLAQPKSDSSTGGTTGGTDTSSGGTTGGTDSSTGSTTGVTDSSTGSTTGVTDSSTGSTTGE